MHRVVMWLLATVCFPLQPLRAQRLAAAASFTTAVPKRLPPTFQAAADPCRRSPGRVLLQLGAGVAGAWIGGAWAYEIADEWGVSKPQGDAVLNRAGNNGFIVGSWLGSAGAAYLAGNQPRVCGSLWRTTLGTSLATSFLLLEAGDAYLPLIGVVLVAPLQSIGGTALYR